MKCLRLFSAFCLTAVVTACAAVACGEERSLSNEDTDAIMVAVLKHYFSFESDFAKAVGEVVFVATTPKRGEASKDISDDVTKHFGNRPTVRKASEAKNYESDPKTSKKRVYKITIFQMDAEEEDSVIGGFAISTSGAKDPSSYQYTAKKVKGRWQVTKMK